MNIHFTLIAQAITFAIFIWFSVKFVWPPLLSVIEKRQKEIADGLAAGERGRSELEQSSKRSAEVTNEAKQRATEIVAQAEKRAVEIIESAKEAAKVEGDRIIAGAKAEIDQELNRAKEGLRQQVSALAISGAEKILRKEIDANTHTAMLNTIAKEL